jgi:hypothetical protein
MPQGMRQVQHLETKPGGIGIERDTTVFEKGMMLMVEG